MENNLNENELFKDNEFSEKIIKENLRISNYVTGQRWVTLHGDFTSSELYDIANKIEAAFNKAFKKK